MISSKIKSVAQKIAAFTTAPSSAQVQTVLFVLGVTLLVAGSVSGAMAQGNTESGYQYDDTRIAEAVDIILVYLQGSFGALVMVCAGIGAILSSAFGQYRAALGLLVVAVGAFILRSLIGTFFNTERVTINSLTGN